MKTVTALIAQEKNKKRVNVYLDGEFYCGMDLFTVLSNRIKVGESYDEKRIEELAAIDNYSSALEKALSYISKAMHTKMQMIIYLKKKGYDGKTIAKVIDKLQEYGYVDDESYAQKYVAEKALSGGKRKIAFELKTKGVDEKTVEKVFADGFDEDEGCQRVTIKYLKGRALDKDLKQKCYRYLIGKGFSYDTAKRTLDKIAGETSEDEDSQD